MLAQGTESACGVAQIKQICDSIFRNSASESEGALQLRTQVSRSVPSCEASMLGCQSSLNMCTAKGSILDAKGNLGTSDSSCQCRRSV